jgi:hypothetical protein
VTTTNPTIEASNGVSYAYRRLAEPSASAPPLVSLQHFHGNLDNWGFTSRYPQLAAA